MFGGKLIGHNDPERQEKVIKLCRGACGSDPTRLWLGRASVALGA